MKLKPTRIFNTSVSTETASTKKLRNYQEVFFKTSCNIYVA